MVMCGFFVGSAQLVIMRVTDPFFVYPPKPLFVPAHSDSFSQIENDPNWIAEVKKNGWRMMVRVTPERKIELWTRHKTLELSPLPNLRRELLSLNLPQDSILDGELLEHRGQTKEVLMLWGMFRLDGKWMNTVPYKEIIWKMSIIPETKYLTKPKFVFENKRKFYEEVLREGEENEGLVIKKLEAPVPFSFNNCPDIRSWIKVKPNA